MTPDVMPPTERAELLRLRDAASPLPFRLGAGGSEVLYEEGILDANGEAVLVDCGRGAGSATPEDEAYLVAAANAVPRLLAMLEEAEVECERLRLEKERGER